MVRLRPARNYSRPVLGPLPESYQSSRPRPAVKAKACPEETPRLLFLWTRNVHVVSHLSAVLAQSTTDSQFSGVIF